MNVCVHAHPHIDTTPSWIHLHVCMSFSTHMCTTACLPLQRYCQSAYTVTVCITPNTEHGLPHTSLVVVHVSFMVTWSEMKKLVRLGAAPRISFTEVTSQKYSTTNCCYSDILCMKHLRTFSWYHDYDTLCMQQWQYCFWIVALFL